MSKAEFSTEGAQRKGAVATAVTFNTPHASATDAMIEGMADFIKMAERVQQKKPHLRNGHLFEAIVAAKENVDRAMQGSRVRTKITHFENHRDRADLARVSGKRVVSRVQTKFTKAENPSSKLIKDLLDPKYEDMDLIVPSDKIDQIKEKLLKFAKSTGDPETAERARSALKRLKEKATDTREVLSAKSNPKRYARTMETRQVLREMGTTVAASAASAAIVSGAVAAVKNGLSMARGDLTAPEAAKETAKAAGKGGVHGAGVGVVGTGVRYAAKKVGQEVLAKSNVATAIAAGIIDVGVSVYSYAKGEISAEEAVEKIGETGLNTMSGIYAGAVAGAFFGPVGMVVGSVAGFFVASSVWQSCLAVLRSARLAEAESERLVALMEVAADDMRRHREEFENLFSTRLSKWRANFDGSLTALDAAMEASDPEQASVALGAMALLFGRELQFTNFDEFDEFMMSGDDPLVI